MSSLVLELQRESYDSKVSITALLRKAYVVAKKLKVKEFQQWLDLELNGYNGKNVVVPDYRKVTGVIKAWNPYHGWIPVLINDSSMYKLLSSRTINQAIAELESVLHEESVNLAIMFPPEVEIELSKMGEFQTQYQLFINNSQIEKIIEAVRNIVLNWALKLEEDGIIGEGMSFSEKEKAVASEGNYTINHFHGNMNNTQLQQNTNNSTQSMVNETIDISKVLELVKLLEENINEIELSQVKKSEIDAELKTINSQILSQKPKHRIIKESFSTIRNILEGATGSILASGLLYKLGLFLN